MLECVDAPETRSISKDFPSRRFLERVVKARGSDLC